MARKKAGASLHRALGRKNCSNVLFEGGKRKVSLLSDAPEESSRPPPGFSEGKGGKGGHLLGKSYRVEGGECR